MIGIDVVHVVYDLKASDTSISKTMLLPSHSSCCHSPRYQRLQLVQSVRVASSWTPGQIPLIWSISLGSYATWLDFLPQNLGAADELRSEAMMQRRPSLKKLKRQILGRNAVMAVQSEVSVTDWKATINITHFYIYIHQYCKSVSILWMRQELEDLEANRKS